MDEVPHPVTQCDAGQSDGTAVTLAYDTGRFPFAPLMCEELGISSFSELPIGDPEDTHAALAVNRGFRRQLEQTPLDGPLLTTFREFMSFVMSPLFGPRISHTQRPVLRIQIGQSPSISAPHRDVDYTRRWDYINGWIPMLDVPADLGLRVETSYGSGDFRSAPLRYGEFLLFDGGALEHYSPSNRTLSPRVSLDFRFTPRQPSALAERLLSARPPDIESRHVNPRTQDTRAGAS